MSELKKIKTTRNVDYKGVAIKSGVTVDLDVHIADRLIAAGDAVEASSVSVTKESKQRSKKK